MKDILYMVLLLALTSTLWVLLFPHSRVNVFDSCYWSLVGALMMRFTFGHRGPKDR